MGTLALRFLGLIPGSLGCHGLGKQSVCSSFILFYGSLCKVLRDAFMNGFLLMLLLVRDLREGALTG